MTARVPLPFEGGIIGMIHLPALPGSPEAKTCMDEIEAFAIAEAHALAEGGCVAIMVENFGDVPFHRGPVPAITVATMARIVRAVVAAVALPVGVNVLRNDVAIALIICGASGARFVSVNVHVGAMLTDQGLIQGEAAATLRLRESLKLGPGGPHPVAILADVGVKHAVPMEATWSLENEAKDAWHRGLADALIVSGAGTGQPTSEVDLAMVRSAVPKAPLLIGSGFTQERIDLLKIADGAIVGTALKVEGKTEKARVQELVASLKSN